MGYNLCAYGAAEQPFSNIVFRDLLSVRSIQVWVDLSERCRDAESIAMPLAFAERCSTCCSTLQHPSSPEMGWLMVHARPKLFKGLHCTLDQYCGFSRRVLPQSSMCLPKAEISFP